MLVLTRRPGESVIIGKYLVKIKVLDSSKGSVRLGIDAPKELSVHREEIYHCIENGSLKKNTNSKNKLRSITETKKTENETAIYDPLGIDNNDNDEESEGNK